MPLKVSPRQLITALEPGLSALMYDPEQPFKVIAQVSCVGEVYYLAGPLLYDYLPELALGELFNVGRSHQDTEANVAQMLNKVLTDCGVPVEAHLYCCQGAQDAIDTLGELFAAYR